MVRKGTWDVEMHREECLGNLKLIRENKVGESLETRPFNNLFPKKILRTAKGTKPKKETTE